MALTTQKRVIGGREFAVTQLPAKRAVRLSHRLTRTLGPAFLRIADGSTGGITGLLDGKLGGLATVVEALTDRLSEDELDSLIDALLCTATLNGKEVLPTFDILFQGQIVDVFKLLAFAIEVNFHDFFELLKSSRPPLPAAGTQAASESASPPPTQSSGP